MTHTFYSHPITVFHCFNLYVYDMKINVNIYHVCILFYSIQYDTIILHDNVKSLSSNVVFSNFRIKMF